MRSAVSRWKLPSELYPGEAHETERHEPGDDEGDAEALQAVGHVAVLQLLADPGQRHDGQRPAHPAAEAVHRRLGESVVALHHEQRAAEDGAVHRDQRQEDAEGVVQGGHVAIQRHLQNLHQRGDHADIADQTQEREVDLGQAGPGERPLGQEDVVDQVVHRHRDALHRDHGQAEAERRLDLLRHGQEGAHAEEKGERQVLDEDRFDEEIEMGFHHITSVRCTSWIWNSGSSFYSGFQLRMAQISMPMMKNALGGSSIMPLRSYQPPSLISGSIWTPSSVPAPNSSRTTATAIRMML